MHDKHAQPRRTLAPRRSNRKQHCSCLRASRLPASPCPTRMQWWSLGVVAPNHVCNRAVSYVVPDSPTELRTNVTFSFLYGNMASSNGTRPLAVVFNDLGVNSNWYSTLAQTWADQGFAVAVFDFYKPLFLPNDAAQSVLGVPRTYAYDAP